MIQIKFDPKTLQGQLNLEWNEWQVKADAATDRVIEAWEEWRRKGSPGEFKFKFEDSIWKGLKDWLLRNVFHNKCAYCETREIRSFYDAEHYRPKGAVTVKAANRKLQACNATDEYGNTMKHPGYFWLAYNWINLLPSCSFCNTFKGKKSQFPVKTSHSMVKLLKHDDVLNLHHQIIKSKTKDDIYYLQPEDLNRLEDPLLLHPYLDNPDEHLAFGEFGVVTARNGSEKGKRSIEVYNLDSGELTTARQIAQENALRDFLAEIGRGKNLSNKDRLNAAKAVIAGYLNGEEPYSAGVMANLKDLSRDLGLVL